MSLYVLFSGMWFEMISFLCVLFLESRVLDTCEMNIFDAASFCVLSTELLHAFVLKLESV